MIDTDKEREKFLVVLLALSKRIERAAKKSFNDVFLKAMMKLRRLILRLERRTDQDITVGSTSVRDY